MMIAQVRTWLKTIFLHIRLLTNLATAAPQAKLRLLLRTDQCRQPALETEKVFTLIKLLKIFGFAACEIFFEHLFHRLSKSGVLNNC